MAVSDLGPGLGLGFGPGGLGSGLWVLGPGFWVGGPGPGPGQA